jgi:hypothetical protein
MKEFFNFIYMEEQKFIFVYNPKVACTNWKGIMRYLNGAQDYFNPALAHNKLESGLSFLSETESALELLLDKNIRKYSFIRNPYSRILSAYLNKVEPYVNNERDEHSDNSYFYTIYQYIDAYRVDKLPGESDVNFYCFLHWLTNVNNVHTNNEHWLSQVKLLRTSEVKYDFIGKFENIDKDAAYLLKEINCDIEFPNQKKVSFAPTNAKDKLDQYYTEKEKELVYELYKMDFNEFNYSK